MKRFTNGAPCRFLRGLFPGFLCGTSVVRVVPRLFLAVVWRFQSKYGTTYYRHRVLIGFSLSQLFSVFNRSMERLLTISGSSKVILSHNGTSLRLPASFTVVVTCCHVLVYRVSARASAGVFSVRGFKVTTTAYVHVHFCTAFPGFYWWRPTWYGDSHPILRRETYTTLFIVRRGVKCTLSVSFFRTTTTIQGYTQEGVNTGVWTRNIQSLSAAPAYGNE